MAVALVLRVHCLIFPYLWLDEYVTLWSIGGQSYTDMFDRALHWTASGPLFVLCFRLTSDAAGNADWGLKLPGVIGGTLSVWAVWWTSRKLFDRTDVAMLSAWLVALAPQFIHFSQEARPYMLGALQIMLAIGFLASWNRTGRLTDLAGVVVLSVTAVGFHLLAVLAIVAENVMVICIGTLSHWPKKRWLVWTIAQGAIACGLWIVSAQLWTLSARHGSMILETSLPMMTRMGLDKDLWSELRIEFTLLLALVGLGWFAKRDLHSHLAKAWGNDCLALFLAAGCYLIPTLLLSALSALRVIDCWPRYYFLFHPGFMIGLAWVLSCGFPKNISRAITTVVLVAMIWQFNFVGGLLSCRLNGGWLDFSQAQWDLRHQIGPGDLLISRAGLIEANHPSFLTQPAGASYLKSFCEAKEGPLPCEHIPLPFSPESEASTNYLDTLIREKLSSREDFWLVNIGPADFDYREWIGTRLSGQFRKVKELSYPALLICHYSRCPAK